MTTGVGAALNKVDIRPGESVAVYGCGGGGLNVVQGARLSGANPIIAVDPDPSKLEIARQFGATDGVIAGKEARAGVRALSGGRGADYASHDGTVSKVQRRLDAGWRKLVAGPSDGELRSRSACANRSRLSKWIRRRYRAPGVPSCSSAIRCAS